MLKRSCLVLTILALGLILAACGDTGSQVLTLSQTTPAPNATPFQLATINSPDILPRYPGSTPFILPDSMTDVFSKAGGPGSPSMEAYTTPDSLDKIKDFFHAEYKKRGWHGVETLTPASVGNVWQGVYTRGSQSVVIGAMDNAAAKSIGLLKTFNQDNLIMVASA